MRFGRGGPWEHGGFDPFSEGGMDPGRMFRRHGGLRYYMLWLISAKPLNGSEIMAEIQKQTAGWWRPSPGSIYPLLSTLESEGSIIKGSDGRYSLTDAGKDSIGIPRGEGFGGTGGDSNLEKILTDLESNATYLSEIPVDIKQIGERLKKVIDSLTQVLHKNA